MLARARRSKLQLRHRLINGQGLRWQRPGVWTDLHRGRAGLERRFVDGREHHLVTQSTLVSLEPQRRHFASPSRSPLSLESVLGTVGRILLY